MSNYLVHYGIKGMKWGVRRYENESGYLTPAGIARYHKDSNGEYKGINRGSSSSSRTRDAHSRKHPVSNSHDDVKKSVKSDAKSLKGLGYKNTSKALDHMRAKKGEEYVNQVRSKYAKMAVAGLATGAALAIGAKYYKAYGKNLGSLLLKETNAGRKILENKVINDVYDRYRNETRTTRYQIAKKAVGAGVAAASLYKVGKNTGTAYAVYKDGKQQKKKNKNRS